MNAKRKKLNNKGVSIVEVIVALTIFTIVTLPLLTSFGQASKVNIRAKKTQRATSLAQNVMESVKSYATKYAESKNPNPEGNELDLTKIFKKDSQADGTDIITSSMYTGYTLNELKLLDENKYEIGSPQGRTNQYYYGIFNVCDKSNKFDVIIKYDAQPDEIDPNHRTYKGVNSYALSPILSNKATSVVEVDTTGNVVKQDINTLPTVNRKVKIQIKHLTNKKDTTNTKESSKAKYAINVFIDESTEKDKTLSTTTTVFPEHLFLTIDYSTSNRYVEIEYLPASDDENIDDFIKLINLYVNYDGGDDKLVNVNSSDNLKDKIILKSGENGNQTYSDSTISRYSNNLNVFNNRLYKITVNVYSHKAPSGITYDYKNAQKLCVLNSSKGE